MPAYDFKCNDCEKRFSVRVSIKEKENLKCPECHSLNIHQVFSPISVSVKDVDGSNCDKGCGLSKSFG